MCRFAAVLAAIFACAVSSAAPPTPAEDFWTFPDGSIAFFAFDPGPLGDGIDKDPTRALVEAGLRDLISNIATVDSGGSPVPPCMLTPGILGPSAYRLCLMDLGVSTPQGAPSPDRPLKIERIAAVLEVRAPPSRHDELIGILHRKLDAGAHPGASGTESAVALPGGRKGTAFTRDDSAAWQEVSWASGPSSLLIGLGHGALERWLSAAAARPDARPEWIAHRSSVYHLRGPTTPVLEAMVDASALRRAVPDEFARGRMGRLAEAWHIRNARELMLHVGLPKPAPVEPGEPVAAATAAPLLLIDFSYSSRADPPPTCASIPISEGAWPEGVLPVPVGPPYAAVFAANWEQWITLSLDTWVACSPRAGLESSAARNRWMRAHSAAMARLIARSGPWVVLNGSGAPALRCDLKPAGPQDRLETDAREVFSSLSSDLRYEAGQRAWSLNLPAEHADPDKLLEHLFWTLRKGEPTLRASWDAAKLAPPAR